MKVEGGVECGKWILNFQARGVSLPKGGSLYQSPICKVDIDISRNT